MPDLGTAQTWNLLAKTNVWPVLAMPRSGAISAISIAGRLYPEPIYRVVTDMVPDASNDAIEIFSPGAVTFDAPVDANGEATITVKCRKNVHYTDTWTFGWPDGADKTFDLSPRLYVERLNDGIVKSAEMTTEVDTWVTLTVVMPTGPANGVLRVYLVATGFVRTNAVMAGYNNDHPLAARCYFADLSLSVA